MYNSGVELVKGGEVILYFFLEPQYDYYHFFVVVRGDIKMSFVLQAFEMFPL